MRLALQSARRLCALGLCCWVMAAPLTAFARDAALCRHRAMHQGMAPGDSSRAPCWCSDMGGNATVIATETPSLPAERVLLPADPVPGLAIVAPIAGLIPPSPCYAPTPPPPNERHG